MENLKVNQKVKFPMNNDCAYEVFKQFDRLQDHMNFAESFDGLQDCVDRIYKNRYSRILLDFKRRLDIERIMYHLGPFVKSLALKFSKKANYSVDNLVTIQKTCEQLEQLAIIGFSRGGYKGGGNPFQDRFSGTLETLFLSSCSLGNDDNFFECFTIGKSLTMLDCKDISVTAMQRCFEKNQQIESFACNSTTLDYSKFLHLLPNLKRLGIIYNKKIFGFLSTSPSLRSLALDCAGGMVNKVLRGLVLNANISLEELELENVFVNEETFVLLEKFNELHRLIISSMNRRYRLLPTDKLPPKVKSLSLKGFDLCERRFHMMIEQSINDIKFSNCIRPALTVQWIQNYNKREDIKHPVEYVLNNSNSAPPTTANSMITLNDFSKKNLPFPLSRVSFPALKTNGLTDIEAEVDAYGSNSFRSKFFAFIKKMFMLSVPCILFYSLVTHLLVRFG